MGLEKSGLTLSGLAGEGFVEPAPQRALVAVFKEPKAIEPSGLSSLVSACP
jgi:hypothetical protein